MFHNAAFSCMDISDNDSLTFMIVKMYFTICIIYYDDNNLKNKKIKNKKMERNVNLCRNDHTYMKSNGLLLGIMMSHI